MLGDELIKNERIALVELIKNAYDADSPWVRIHFNRFGRAYATDADSEIVVEDAGHGMTRAVIEKQWLQPAAPAKGRRKGEERRTPKGRYLQGEKGIGRFAMLKLGRTITVTTRPEGQNVEYVISHDFAAYDPEFFDLDGATRDRYLDELRVTVQERVPETFVGGEHPPHGTRIAISELKTTWSEDRVKGVGDDSSYLLPIFAHATAEQASSRDDFAVAIYKDGKEKRAEDDHISELGRLFNERAVLRVENGVFDVEQQEYRFALGKITKTVSLLDERVSGFAELRKHFGFDEGALERLPECGPFGFAFYVFDRSAKAHAAHRLDTNERKVVKQHKVYLYRDGVRVYPYGDPNDDWLGVDADRGTLQAGLFLSTDQVVGYVSITHGANRSLRDKTNREGLLEDSNASRDLVILVRALLTYLRRTEYTEYTERRDRPRDYEARVAGAVDQRFAALLAVTKGDRKAKVAVAAAKRAYQAQRDHLVTRAEVTEDLAAVGLSVEIASHDVLAIQNRACEALDRALERIRQDGVDADALERDLYAVRGMLSSVVARLEGIQPLFRSAKQRRRAVRVREQLAKVERIYMTALERASTKVEVETVGSPLVAKATDAVLLQLFINLFDNSLYWLQAVPASRRQIMIRLNGAQGQLIFADSGPGVHADDRPHIFDAFYSAKGEEGRGLGLYIARQLLERGGYTIELLESTRECVLPGANFLVSFIEEES